jgi:hypothetical protein
MLPVGLAEKALDYREQLLLAWFLPFEDNHNFILPAIAYQNIYKD